MGDKGETKGNGLLEKTGTQKAISNFIIFNLMIDSISLYNKKLFQRS